MRANTLDQFWPRVDRSGGPMACWPWRGTIHKTGYGLFKLRGHKHYAHRLAYSLARGGLDPTLDVCHHCDNPCCCHAECEIPGCPHLKDTPGCQSHLFAGAHRDNMLDRDAKGRNPAKGGRGQNAKLTAAMARAIRAAYAAGEANQYELAAQYDCSQINVWRIVHDLLWKRA